MFVTFLRFGENSDAAPDHMAAHSAWITQAFEDGAFLAVGSLQPGLGGAILAHGESREAHDARIARDPFVLHDVVVPETFEIDAKRTVPALAMLTAAEGGK